MLVKHGVLVTALAAVKLLSVKTAGDMCKEVHGSLPSPGQQRGQQRQGLLHTWGKHNDRIVGGKKAKDKLNVSVKSFML